MIKILVISSVASSREVLNSSFFSKTWNIALPLFVSNLSETFPELFDESYDEIEDMDKRDAFIKKEILRVGTMNQEELHKICESVEEKCIHNQKVLFSCEEIIKQFTDKIKRIYDVWRLWKINDFKFLEIFLSSTASAIKKKGCINTTLL